MMGINKFSCLLLVLFFSYAAGLYAEAKPVPLPGKILIELGGYWRTPASEQFIAIDDLIGDRFTSSQASTSNGLFGVGYLMSRPMPLLNTTIHYGINAFYLGKTNVSGVILQEDNYRNLTYQYQTTHYPVYAELKTVPTKYITLQAGIGPNFLNTTDFKERPIISNDKVIPLPNENFGNHTTTTFSATLGVGFQLEHFFGQAPLECGYRFFYLGQGHLSIQNDQIRNTLSTGPLYANAVVCSTLIG